MLLSRRRVGRRRFASLLPARLLLCVIFATVCSSLPAGSKCPHGIDCEKERRYPCKPGSSRCGPCLTLFVENEEGRCVLKKRNHQHGKGAAYSDLEEEIDFLDSVIEKDQVSHVKQSTQLGEVRKQQGTFKQKQENQGKPPAGVLSTVPTATSPPVSVLPNTLSPKPWVSGVKGSGSSSPILGPDVDGLTVILISLCVLVAIVGMILAAVCYVRLRREARLTQKVDYPAFDGGAKVVTVASAISISDKTLAQNAQMYHYQHQKQQMLSMGKHKPEQKVAESEISDEDEQGGDFTVYECPGLAPTGEMEVKNPLFDDSTLHHQGNHK